MGGTALRLCRPSADRAARRTAAKRRRAASSRLGAAAYRRASWFAPVRGDPAHGGFRRRACGAAPIGRPVFVVLPTLPHIEHEVRALAARWPEPPTIVLGEAAKYAAFRAAHASLAASGTVTLELALAGVPMVGAYKVSLVEEQLKYLIKVPSILLPNLILGERAIPEKLQKDCAPAALGAALAEIVRDGPARSSQLEALSRLDRLMALPDGGAPSAHAARAVLETIESGRRPVEIEQLEGRRRRMADSVVGGALLRARKRFQGLRCSFLQLETRQVAHLCVDPCAGLCKCRSRKYLCDVRSLRLGSYCVRSKVIARSARRCSRRVMLRSRSQAAARSDSWRLQAETKPSAAAPKAERRAQPGRSTMHNGGRRDARHQLSACSSAYIRAASRRCRAGGGDRSFAPDPGSSPSTGRSSRRCARPRTKR